MSRFFSFHFLVALPYFLLFWFVSIGIGWWMGWQKIAWLVGIMPALLLARTISQFTTHSLSELNRYIQQLAKGDMSAHVSFNHLKEIIESVQNFKKTISQLQEQNSLLATEQHQLETVLSVIEGGVLIINKDGVVQRTNTAAYALLDIQEEEDVQGYTFTNIIRYHQIIELWQECRQNYSRVTTALEFQRKDKNVFWQVSITPFGPLKIPLYLVLIQDLTAIRHLQIVRRDFISNVSHELRTPLASMKAVVDTLQGGAIEDAEASQRFLTRLEVEVDTMTQTVEELQELARIESGQVPLRLTSANLVEVVLPIVERLQPQAERQEVELRVKMPAKLPPVLIDPKRIQQVVTNLLHNAIKFTPANGKVTVHAYARHNMLFVEVKDTGVGIPEKDLPRIFERFYKIDRARSGGGTGLGLSISRHLIEGHGGRIWAKSKDGKGSIFYFTLPLAQ